MRSEATASLRRSVFRRSGIPARILRLSTLVLPLATGACSRTALDALDQGSTCATDPSCTPSASHSDASAPSDAALGPGQSRDSSVDQIAAQGPTVFPYQVLEAEYSVGIDRVVILADDGALHLVDPHTRDDVTILLPPGTPADLSLSPGGLKAAVASSPPNYVTTFDLVARVPISQYVTQQVMGAVALADRYAYAFPAPIMGTGNPLETIDLATHRITTTPPDLTIDFDGSMGRVSADSKTLYVVMSENGLGRYDISGGSPKVVAESNLAAFPSYLPGWLNRDETLLCTFAGTCFRTSDLTYAATLPSIAALDDFDDRAADGTIAALVATQVALGPADQLQVLDPGTFSVSRVLTFPSQLFPDQWGPPTSGDFAFHDRAGTGLFAIVGAYDGDAGFTEALVQLE